MKKDEITISLPIYQLDGSLNGITFRMSRELFNDPAGRYTFLIHQLASQGVAAPADIELRPVDESLTYYISLEEYHKV